MTRPLVVAAHGTTSAAGRAVVHDCAERAADLLRVPVRVGYVDVCEPTLAQALVGGPAPVVVPLFLTSGYHVRHDLPASVGERPGTVVAPALGAAAAVVEALAGRLGEAVGSRRLRSAVDGVVLTSAGSTHEPARAEVRRVAALLADRVRVPVEVAYLSGPGPRLEKVCGRHRAAGRSRLAVASHLLAPGVFLDRARLQGANAGVLAVADELGSHPAISTLVAARYMTAVGAAA